jgi:prolyl oligopeptidase
MPLNAFNPEQVVEVLHGATVIDLYRWLEERNSPDTEDWICEQNRQIDEYFRQILGLSALRSRVKDYLNVETLDQPNVLGDRIFYRRRGKDQEQANICVRDAAGEQERVLVDPSSQGVYSSVAIHQISGDGSLLAYESKQGGSDASEIRVVNTLTGEKLHDYLPIGLSRGFAFTPDRLGFCYCREVLQSSEDHVIWFHRFGNVNGDLALFRAKRTRDSRLVLVADDIHLGAIYAHQSGDEFCIDFWLSQQNQNLQWHPIFIDKPAPCALFLYRGRIFARTEENSPNGKVVELSKDGAEIRVVIPESSTPIQSIVMAGGFIYASFLVSRRPIIHGWTIDGVDSGPVKVPENGSTDLLPNQGGSDVLFFSSESFSDPIATFLLRDGGEEPPIIWHQKRSAARAASLDIKCIRYTSFDEVEIPMWLVMRSDCDPSNFLPVILTGYGGFGISATPRYSVLVSIMLELGAAFALPNIRGGQEFGKVWHEAARARNRGTAFNDFISAAEWLVAEGITSPGRLAVFGGSNSGLLVGAAITQRPDLFRAALCIAPLLDMLRYEHFDQARRWKREYGTVENADDFASLFAYSPYHRVRDDVDYPATLFVSGDKDDRCNPAHARKMTAQMQANSAQRNPILLDYSRERGHSPVLPLSVRAEALTRRIAFLCRELRIPIPSGEN